MDSTAVTVATIAAVGVSFPTVFGAWLTWKTRRENLSQHGDTASLLAEHTEQDAENFRVIRSEIGEVRSTLQSVLVALAGLPEANRAEWTNRAVGDGPVPQPLPVGRTAPPSPADALAHRPA